MLFMRLSCWRMPASLLCLLLWCAPAMAAKPLVVASIEPLARLAQEFYGPQVEVQTLLLPSQNPHQVSFTPQQLRLLYQADLVVWLGAAAEPYLTSYLQRRERPSLALLAQAGVTPLREMHGHHGDEHVGAVDPHLWLSPQQMEQLLPALQQAGVALGLPQQQLSARAAAMAAQLTQMQASARQQLASLAQTPWLSYHNPWRYLQQALGLTQPLQVEQQLGTEIGSRHFIELAGQMRQQQVGCALLEPEARRAVMAKLCQAPGCKLVALDPLGRDVGRQTYSQWWQGLVGKFQQCLVAD